jgi:hypothetical protein
MNDGDSFKICLNFEDLYDLIITLNLLGFNLIKSILNVENEFDVLTPEYDKIKEYPEYIKPGIQTAFGTEWILSIQEGKLIISIAGTGLESKYDVTDLDFKKCVMFESLLEEKNLTKMIDTNFNYKSGCISVENYPDLFKNIN